LLRAYTRVFAVPRSIAKSFEKYLRSEANAMVFTP
jgi:hypothetical protein